MENLVNMIEGILEKSNRIQQGFLDRIEANDLRLSRIESRIESIESDIENIYGRQIKIPCIVNNIPENGIKDLYANQSNVLNEIQDIHGREIKISNLVRYSADMEDNISSQLDGIADRQKLMSGLVENIEDMLIDLK